jgi:hypothetical protein
MAKQVPDAIQDLMLDQVEGTALHICSAEPANYAGISAVLLAEKTSALGTHTKANGDVSGRKTTCPAQTGISITGNGTANHVVLSNGTDTIKRITTCADQALTAGGTVDTSAFKHEINDPT